MTFVSHSFHRHKAFFFPPEYADQIILILWNPETSWAAAFYFMLVIGQHLGVFDVTYFHYYKCGVGRKYTRSTCNTLPDFPSLTILAWAWCGHVIYVLQFPPSIAHLRFPKTGAALLLLAILYGVGFLDSVVPDVVGRNCCHRRDQGRTLPAGGVASHHIHIVLHP